MEHTWKIERYSGGNLSGLQNVLAYETSDATEVDVQLQVKKSQQVQNITDYVINWEREDLFQNDQEFIELEEEEIHPVQLVKLQAAGDYELKISFDYTYLASLGLPWSEDDEIHRFDFVYDLIFVPIWDSTTDEAEEILSSMFDSEKSVFRFMVSVMDIGSFANLQMVYLDYGSALMNALAETTHHYDLGKKLFAAPIGEVTTIELAAGSIA